MVLNIYFQTNFYFIVFNNTIIRRKKVHENQNLIDTVIKVLFGRDFIKLEKFFYQAGRDFATYRPTYIISSFKLHNCLKIILASSNCHNNSILSLIWTILQLICLSLKTSL